MSPRPRSRTIDTATLDLFDERPGGEPPGDDSPGLIIPARFWKYTRAALPSIPSSSSRDSARSA